MPAVRGVRERRGQTALLVEGDRTGRAIEGGGTVRALGEVVGGGVAQLGGHLGEVVIEEDAGEGTAGDEVD